MTNLNGDSLNPEDDIIPMKRDATRLTRMGCTVQHQEADLAEQVRSGYRQIKDTPLGEDKSTVYAMMHEGVLTREDQDHGFSYMDDHGRHIKRPQDYGSQGVSRVF